MNADLKTRSDDLELLLCVIDAGGFSAAADVLDIQVARVSRAVSRIEKQLGVAILIRTTRRIELTDEGRQFVNTIRKALQAMQSAENDIITRGELPAGKLRINAASPFIYHQLIPLIQPFKLAYPDIELELRSNEGFIDLIENRTDVAIRIGKLADSTLHARSLGTSPLYVVAAPEYIAKRGVPKQPSEQSKASAQPGNSVECLAQRGLLHQQLLEAVEGCQGRGALSPRQRARFKIVAQERKEDLLRQRQDCKADVDVALQGQSKAAVREGQLGVGPTQAATRHRRPRRGRGGG